MSLGGPKLKLDTTERLLQPSETTWAALWTVLEFQETSETLVKLSRVETGKPPGGTSKLKLTGNHVGILVDISALNSEEIKKYFGGQVPRTRIDRYLRADRKRAGTRDSSAGLAADAIYSKNADDRFWSKLNDHFLDLYDKQYLSTKDEYESASNKLWGQTMASLAEPDTLSSIVLPLRHVPPEALSAYRVARQAKMTEPKKTDGGTFTR